MSKELQPAIIDQIQDDTNFIDNTKDKIFTNEYIKQAGFSETLIDNINHKFDIWLERYLLADLLKQTSNPFAKIQELNLSQDDINNKIDRSELQDRATIENKFIKDYKSRLVTNHPNIAKKTIKINKKNIKLIDFFAPEKQALLNLRKTIPLQEVLVESERNDKERIEILKNNNKKISKLLKDFPTDKYNNKKAEEIEELIDESHTVKTGLLKTKSVWTKSILAQTKYREPSYNNNLNTYYDLIKTTSPYSNQMFRLCSISRNPQEKIIKHINSSPQITGGNREFLKNFTTNNILNLNTSSIINYVKDLNKSLATNEDKSSLKYTKMTDKQRQRYGTKNMLLSIKNIEVGKVGKEIKTIQQQTISDIYKQVANELNTRYITANINKKEKIKENIIELTDFMLSDKSIIKAYKEVLATLAIPLSEILYNKDIYNQELYLKSINKNLESKNKSANDITKGLIKKYGSHYKLFLAQIGMNKFLGNNTKYKDLKAFDKIYLHAIQKTISEYGENSILENEEIEQLAKDFDENVRLKLVELNPQPDMDKYITGLNKTDKKLLELGEISRGLTNKQERKERYEGDKNHTEVGIGKTITVLITAIIIAGGGVRAYYKGKSDGIKEAIDQITNDSEMGRKFREYNNLILDKGINKRALYEIIEDEIIRNNGKFVGPSKRVVLAYAENTDQRYSKDDINNSSFGIGKRWKKLVNEQTQDNIALQAAIETEGRIDLINNVTTNFEEDGKNGGTLNIKFNQDVYLESDFKEGDPDTRIVEYNQNGERLEKKFGTRKSTEKHNRIFKIADKMAKKRNEVEKDKGEITQATREDVAKYHALLYVSTLKMMASIYGTEYKVNVNIADKYTYTIKINKDGRAEQRNIEIIIPEDNELN